MRSPARGDSRTSKARPTLRAIIADGRWPAFGAHYLRVRRRDFETRLAGRLRAAVLQGRVPSDVPSNFGVSPATSEVLPAAA